MKILFIIPSLSMGGTTSSLISILNSPISENQDIDVFAIMDGELKDESIIKRLIGNNELTNAYYRDFSNFSLKNKVCYYYIKILKRLLHGNSLFVSSLHRRTVRRIEKKNKYDIIVGFQEGLATQFASLFGCPRKIAWIHCDYSKSYGIELNDLVLYKNFKKIVCVSNSTRNGFILRYPDLDNRTIAIHNLFDTRSIVRKSLASIDDTRFDTSRFTIISLGRVHEVKRFYLIPMIASILRDNGIVFSWYILGNVATTDDLKRLEDEVLKYNVDEYVKYLGSKPNPYPYLKASDLLVTVSKSEACPMIFNEAKILHIPILSSDFDSAYEFIDEGKDGYISPIDMLPNRIMDFIKKTELKESIKNNSVYHDTNGEVLKQLSLLFNDWS